jgi:hypothetical protein
MKLSFKRFFRYSLLALAILFVLWILTITAVYFFVDAEDVKKIAVSAVNENTKGELSIGEVKLKIFPLIHFEIKDLVMKSSTSFKREKVFACESSKLSFNVFTLIFGKPKISLMLRKPIVNVLSDGKKTNLDDLFESSKKESSTPDFLTYLFVSKIYFDIRSADLSYKAPNDEFKIKGLDLNLEIEPVSRKLVLAVKSPIDYKKGLLTVDGVLDFNAKAKMLSKDNTEISLVLDASSLNINSGSFTKSKGELLKLELLADSDLKNVIKVKNLDIYLIEKLFSAKASIKNFMSDSPVCDLDAKLGPYDVKNFARMHKLVKNLGLSGLFKSDLSVKGKVPLSTNNEQSSNLDIVFDLDASDLVFDSSSFKKQKGVYLGLLLKASTNISTVTISQLSAGLADIKLKASGSLSDLDKKHFSSNLDLELPNFLLANLTSFVPELSKYPVSGELYFKLKSYGSINPLPIIKVDSMFNDKKNKNNLKLSLNNTDKARGAFFADIYSSNINLNPYLPESVKQKSKQAKNIKKQTSSSGKAVEDFEVFKKQDVKLIKNGLDGYSLNLKSKMDKVNYQEIIIKNFIIEGLFNEKQLAFSKLNMSLLKGNILAAFKVLLKSEKPVYDGKLNIKGLDVKDAAKIIMPNVGGVIDGVISTNMDLTASGNMMSEIKKTAVGSGDFSFNNFVYSAQDLNELISSKLKDKFGSLGNKKLLGSNPGWETVQGDYTIKDQKINISRLFAKEGEYEAKGKGWLDFNEYMDMYVDLVLPYRNIPYEPLRYGTIDKSMLPIHLTGPILKPKFDAGYFLEHIAKKAIEHETKKLKEAATREAKKLEQELKTKADAEAQKIKAKAKEEAKKASQKLGDDIKKSFKGFKF